MSALQGREGQQVESTSGSALEIVSLSTAAGERLCDQERIHLKQRQ